MDAAPIYITQNDYCHYLADVAYIALFLGHCPVRVRRRL